MLKYLLSNPCHISSIIMIINIPFTIYKKNNIFLLTQIPLLSSTIIYHNHFKCIKNIKEIDIFLGQLAYWHHMYYALYFNNLLTTYCYIVCPLFYLLSKYYEKKEKIYISNFFHSFIHIFLTCGTISLNYQLPNI